MHASVLSCRAVDGLTQKVLAGNCLSKREILSLARADCGYLAKQANAVRRFFCGDRVDICCIVNAKSGRCSEDCKFCAQSSFYQTGAEEYALLPEDVLVENAKKAEQAKIGRYSLVCSGRSPGGADLQKLASCLKRIKETAKVSCCASLGLLDKDAYLLLKQHGL